MAGCINVKLSNASPVIDVNIISSGPAFDPSGIFEMIGDLNDLETTDKDNLVEAINEAARSGGGGGTQTVAITFVDGAPIDTYNSYATCRDGLRPADVANLLQTKSVVAHFIRNGVTMVLYVARTKNGTSNDVRFIGFDAVNHYQLYAIGTTWAISTYPLEFTERKVSSIADADKTSTSKYPSVKAMVDYVASHGGGGGGMSRYIVRLMQSGSTFVVQDYSTGQALSFDTLKAAISDVNNYVVCVYGNSKLRPQYVSTNEMMFIGLDRASSEAKVLRLLITPTRVSYETFPLAAKADVYTKTEIDAKIGNIESALDAILGGA